MARRLFEFIRNGNANAINYFAPRQDSLKRNQFGGTFGGRIIRDKLFFFGGFQESYIRQDPSSSTAFVPTAAALAGDFSALDGSGCQANHQARASSTRPRGCRLQTSVLTRRALIPRRLLLRSIFRNEGPLRKSVLRHSCAVERSQVHRSGRLEHQRQALLYGRYLRDAYKLAAFFDPHDILVTSSNRQCGACADFRSCRYLYV